jgi:hypothetical protein
MSGELPPDPQQSPAEESPPQHEASPQRYRLVRLQPHRGNTVLGLGISGVVLAIFGSMMALSIYFCCPLWLLPLASLGFSIPAWTMGQRDLAAMSSLKMDPAGKEVTMIGMICGIIGVSIIALGFTMIVGIVALYAIVMAISAASS